ncbi:MAG: hypothetical protein M3Q60_19235 [Actinomycetota bacterium]|nr:hypothetical protein [Actinomycetota bacterium]
MSGLPPPWNDKERHLRWMEMMWERHQTNAREERRTREVVEVFEGIAELSRRRVEAPHFPPWELP